MEGQNGVVGGSGGDGGFGGGGVGVGHLPIKGVTCEN